MHFESVSLDASSKRNGYPRRSTLRSKTHGRYFGLGKAFGRVRAGASDGSGNHERDGEVRIASGRRDKFLFAFVAPALVALALPSAISTKPGASAVSTAISTILPGTFKIDRICIGWNKPFKMSGLFVFLPFSRVPVFRMESMESECSLWDAITKRKGHKTWIKGLEIDMSPSHDGSPLALAAFTRATKSTTLDYRLKNSTGIVSFSLDGGESGLHIEQSSIVMDSVLASAVGNTVKLQVSAADQWEDSSQDKRFVSGTRHQTKSNGHYKCSAMSDSLNADFELVETSTKPAVHGKVNIELRMTTSLYDKVLGRINPLLRGIVSVSENIIYATIWPKSGYLNDEVWEFEVEPLQAQVLGNNTTTAVINFLKNYQVSNSDDQMKVLQPQYQYRIGRLTGQVSKQGDIWLNESEIYLGGPTNEMRLLVGGRTFQEDGDVMLDTYVSIPRQELERFLKLHHLPSNYSLKLPIHGSQCKPMLEWKHATEELLRMLARQAIVESGHPLARRIGRTLFDPTNP